MIDPDESIPPSTAVGGLVRPMPPVGVAERAAAWLDWFGLARLAATVCSVLVVAVGAYWLVRAPAPAAEATLPVVATAAPPVVTLPTPVPAATSVPVVSLDPSPIFVHVAGAVTEPGVYELPVDARVDDAIDRAGGATSLADLDAVNLAQVLTDGQRLFVPELGTIDHVATPVLSPPADPVGDPGDPAGDASRREQRGPIDVNRADATELEELPGVGPATAQAIVDDRERNGPFVTVDDLERVPGVGPAKLAALRDLVTV